MPTLHLELEFNSFSIQAIGIFSMTVTGTGHPIIEAPGDIFLLHECRSFFSIFRLTITESLRDRNLFLTDN